jgi:hypothetical protein
MTSRAPERPQGLHAGKTIIEMLEYELDSAISILETANEIESYDDGYEQGIVFGLAHALAIIRNPYQVGLDRTITEIITAANARVDSKED